jgi:SsrA-binding protein
MAKSISSSKNDDGKSIAVSRRAFYDYEILERFEGGLVLTGTEIKSVRAGKVDLRDAYARSQNGELWLHNTYIGPYGPASTLNHEPKRSRKLLMHRDEIAKLTSVVAQKGLTLVALRIYIKNHVAKVELGLGRGKRQYDKRRTIINRELDLAARRAMTSAHNS